MIESNDLVDELRENCDWCNRCVDCVTLDAHAADEIERLRVIEAQAKVATFLLDIDGSPCGFRFREEMLKLRKMVDKSDVDNAGRAQEVTGDAVD